VGAGCGAEINLMHEQTGNVWWCECMVELNSKRDYFFGMELGSYNGLKLEIKLVEICWTSSIIPVNMYPNVM
jgi:hypothetical protein